VFSKVLGAVYALAISPDGQWLAVGDGAGRLQLWDTRTGREQCLVEAHENSVWSVAIAPDGAWLASGSDDSTVKVWSAADGRCLQTLQGHKNSVWSVAIAPDGAWLASSSSDQTVRIWDVRTGECLQVLNHQLYAGANIAGVAGLTKAQRRILLSMGAVDAENSEPSGIAQG
jgi:WD40 repeat protein